VNEAAKGSRDITSNIAGMARAAPGATHGAAEPQNASQQLVEMSEQLRSLLGQSKSAPVSPDRK
jgi:methyl-accepting chemotaxis protein